MTSLFSPGPAAERRLPRLLGAYAGAGGALSLLGWMFGVQRLAAWDGSSIAMQPNAALCAICIGAALILLCLSRPRIAAALSTLAGALALATLAEHATGAKLGIDALLLFGHAWGTQGTVAAGRMGLPGSISWALLAAAILLLAGRTRWRRLAPVLALVVLAIASLSLIGAAFGASNLHTLPRSTAIAFQTASFIFTAAVGVLLAAPEYEPVRALVDPGDAAHFGRRALLAVVLLPILMGYVRLRGERAGLYDTATGAAFLMLPLIIMLCAVLWWGVRTVTARERALQLGARTQRLLAGIGELAARTGPEGRQDVDALVRAILERVGRELAASRCRMTNVDLDAGWVTIAQEARAGGEPLRGRYPASEYVLPFLADGQAGRTIVVEDMATDPRTAPHFRRLFEPFGMRAAIGVPLHRDGQWVATFSVNAEAPRAWSAAEVDLVRTIAERVWSVVEQARVAEALRESDRRKDEFLAMLAHELRNPLGPVRHAAGVLKLKDLPDPELRRPVEMIESQVGHMARLLDDLLDVSRIARGVIELRREPVLLADVTYAAADACRDEIHSRAQTIDVELPREAVWLDADRHRLIQVLWNLIANASRYTDAGGHIELVANARDGALQIEVRDTGVGIPAEKLDEIFELFAQVDRSRQRSGGLGIGLTLARALVELHGGSIEARSRGVGQGSTFVVRLPVARESAVPAAPQPRAPVCTPCRILVADDNRDAADSLAALLAVMGHDVRVAYDGQEAIDTAAEFRPDAALLDIGMPRLNGYDVARRVRSEPWGRGMLLVAITGWGRAGDREQAVAAGFDHHLVKPAAPDVLQLLLASASGRPDESQTLA